MEAVGYFNHVFDYKPNIEPLSLEEKLIEAGLDPQSEINQQRLNFSFPKNFDFKEEKFRHKVLYLFNKNDFSEGKAKDEIKKRVHIAKVQKNLENRLRDIHLKENFVINIAKIAVKYELVNTFLNPQFHEGRKDDKAKKRVVRNIYQEKARDYLIEHFTWPKKISDQITKTISLPAYLEERPNYYFKEHKGKNTAYYLKNSPTIIKDFIPVAKRGLIQSLELIAAVSVIGNYPQRFVEPISQFMNIKRKLITRANIAYDIGILAIEAGPAYSIIKDVSENGLFNGGPLYADLAKVSLYSYWIGHTAMRVAQIFVRTYYCEAKNKHIPSYATTNSPNPFMAAITIPPILYDHIQGRKEKKTMKIIYKANIPKLTKDISSRK